MSRGSHSQVHDAGEVSAPTDRRADLEQRLVDGQPVTAEELAAADHAVRLAEAEARAAEERGRRDTQAAHEGRLQAIRAALTDGHVESRARKLVTLAERASAALGALSAEAKVYVEDLFAIALDLQRELPELRHNQVGRKPVEGFTLELSNWRLTMDGIAFRFPRNLPAALVAEAAYSVAGNAGASLARASGVRDGTQLKALRRVSQERPAGTTPVLSSTPLAMSDRGGQRSGRPGAPRSGD